jgi:hypothetical protein
LASHPVLAGSLLIQRQDAVLISHFSSPVAFVHLVYKEVPVKRILIISLLILYCAAVVNADVYTWTDGQGTVTYTDNPALIPTRSSDRTQAGKKKSLRIYKNQKEIRKHGKKWSQAVIPGNRVKSVAAKIDQQKVIPLEMQSEIKGHLGGDQKDPAPPSMKQPLPISPGPQPPPVSPGMEQPKPLDMGPQPEPLSPGMKQPKPVPTGAQPPPTSAGMEQPDSKQ